MHGAYNFAEKVSFYLKNETNHQGMTKDLVEMDGLTVHY